MAVYAARNNSHYWYEQSTINKMGADISGNFSFSMRSDAPTFTGGNNYEYVIRQQSWVGGNKFSILLGRDNNQWEFGLSTGGSDYTTEVQYEGQGADSDLIYRDFMHTLVGTYNGAESTNEDKGKMYANGELLVFNNSVGTVPTSLSSTNPRLGIFNTANNAYSSPSALITMSHLAFWNVTLTLAEIKALQYLTPPEVRMDGLITYWPLLAPMSPGGQLTEMMGNAPAAGPTLKGKPTQSTMHDNLVENFLGG